MSSLEMISKNSALIKVVSVFIKGKVNSSANYVNAEILLSSKAHFGNLVKNILY